MPHWRTPNFVFRRPPARSLSGGHCYTGPAMTMPLLAPNREKRDFGLTSDFVPTGDQPAAIEKLVEGVERGDRYQTLLGVTGSGKTFTIANVIAQTGRSDAGARAQQDAGRAALLRAQGVLPGERGRVLRLLLRLLPARGLHPAHRHVHREGRGHQRGDRQAAACGHAVAVHAARRDHRRQRELHLRPR